MNSSPCPAWTRATSRWRPTSCRCSSGRTGGARVPATPPPSQSRRRRCYRCGMAGSVTSHAAAAGGRPSLHVAMHHLLTCAPLGVHIAARFGSGPSPHAALLGLAFPGAPSAWPFPSRRKWPVVTLAVGITEARRQPVTEYGAHRAREAINRVDLRARVTGFLEQRLFTEGTEVEEGKLLLARSPHPTAACQCGGRCRHAASRWLRICHP